MGVRKPMEPVTSVAIYSFLQRLSEHFQAPATLYLLGGSALCLLGNSRQTLDVDYTFDQDATDPAEFQEKISSLAFEMKLDLEFVPLSEFIPLPPGVQQRRRFVGRYGNLEVYIFDLYSIGLSKIARGFEADIEDVLFMLQTGLIEFNELEQLFQTILPDVSKVDIDPKEFRNYFEELKRRLI